MAYIGVVERISVYTGNSRLTESTKQNHKHTGNLRSLEFSPNMEKRRLIFSVSKTCCFSSEIPTKAPWRRWPSQWHMEIMMSCTHWYMQLQTLHLGPCDIFFVCEGCEGLKEGIWGSLPDLRSKALRQEEENVTDTVLFCVWTVGFQWHCGILHIYSCKFL